MFTTLMTFIKPNTIKILRKEKWTSRKVELLFG